MVEALQEPAPASPQESSAWARKLYTEANLFPWDYFVARSGEEGARWMTDYVQTGCAALQGQIDGAVRSLRRRALPEGHRQLREVWDEICRMGEDRADLKAVITRWYLTAIAYYRYLSSDFESAARDVDTAQASVEEAIRITPVLLPLAHHYIEFQSLRARIARERRDWDRMRFEIDLLRRLAEDRHPLCRTADGTPVYFTTLDRYLLGLPDLNSEEVAFLGGLLNREVRLRRLESFARHFYALPGLVIPYA